MDGSLRIGKEKKNPKSPFWRYVEPGFAYRNAHDAHRQREEKDDCGAGEDGGASVDLVRNARKLFTLTKSRKES